MANYINQDRDLFNALVSQFGSTYNFTFTEKHNEESNFHYGMIMLVDNNQLDRNGKPVWICSITSVEQMIGIDMFVRTRCNTPTEMEMNEHQVYYDRVNGYSVN